MPTVGGWSPGRHVRTEECLCSNFLYLLCVGSPYKVWASWLCRISTL